MSMFDSDKQVMEAEFFLLLIHTAPFTVKAISWPQNKQQWRAQTKVSSSRWGRVEEERPSTYKKHHTHEKHRYYWWVPDRRKWNVHTGQIWTHMCMCIRFHIYVYIYICRERERETCMVHCFERKKMSYGLHISEGFHLHANIKVVKGWWWMTQETHSISQVISSQSSIKLFLLSPVTQPATAMKHNIS